MKNQLVTNLRKATLNDCRLLLDWRNDAMTLANSHNSRPVTEIEHKRWLVSALNDPLHYVFIWMSDGVPCGNVRAQFRHGRYVLSWVVAPEHRGRGIGKRMVAAIIRAIESPVRAEIKSDNVASVAIAEHCGMTLVSDVDGVRVYESV